MTHSAAPAAKMEFTAKNASQSGFNKMELAQLPDNEHLLLLHLLMIETYYFF